MIKATVDNFWINEDAQPERRMTAAAFYNWLGKTKLALRHFVLSHTGDSSALVAFIQRQQRKVFTAEQNIKQEFFFDKSDFDRKNIPHKTWKRHSAFLIYRQQINNKQKPQSRMETDQYLDAIINQAIVSEERISFRVKSIRPLPVWATALSDLSVIDNDLSSLRFMETHSVTNITAEAA